MNKCFFRFLVFFQLIIYIYNSIDGKNFDPSLDIILFDDNCYYTDENSNYIYKEPVESGDKEEFMQISGVKNKTLIKVSEEIFILFGLDNENNQFLYHKYNIKTNADDSNIFNIYLPNDGNYTIKLIKDNNYLLYYNSSNNLYLYIISLDSNSILVQSNKEIALENNYILNTIECDSFDTENIFCVYSMFEKLPNYNVYSTLSYYSYEGINVDTLGKNEIMKNIAGPSLLKIEYNNEKKFLICYFENNDNGKNPSIFCQFFLLNENKNVLIAQQTVFIGTTSIYSKLIYKLFAYQNLVQIIRYDYTILIHFKFQKYADYRSSVLFVASIDLNLIVPYYLDPNFGIVELKDILINNNYLLFLKYSSTNVEIKLHKLQIKCPDQQLFHFGGNEKEIQLDKLIKASENINVDDIYMSFGLDTLIYLYVEDTRNFGGLLYSIPLKEEGTVKNSEISLRLTNEDLRISYNYYIYHGKDSGDKFSEYKTLSNFCFLKVLNCYESCKNCSSNIPGTEEIHQCSSCKDKYYIFELDSNEDDHFNCYKTSSGDDIINHYYLDKTDGKYYECNESCKTCESASDCLECSDGYHYKIDKLVNNKLTDICYKTEPSGYYLNSSIGVYEQCYKTCLKCFGKGNSTNNMCLECNAGLISYTFDKFKCTEDVKNCTRYWKINSTNDVQCLSECKGYIIREGKNKGQCVNNCSSYINPFDISTNNGLLLSYDCEDEDEVQKYCITQDFCRLKGLRIQGNECRSGISCFDIDDTSAVTPDSNVQIAKATIVKYFEYTLKYQGNSNNSSKQFITTYFDEYDKEVGYYEDGMDFITVSTYADFKITIYPLNKEEYLYKNVIKTNNLCFANFTEFFREIHYSPKDKHIILVALLEFQNINIPINSINYFFFECEEENNFLRTNSCINHQIKKSNLVSGSSIKLQSEYPLYNFENPNLDSQYSTNLISTIKTLNSIDEDINFFNENNEFYTDICKTFTSEVGTDMTISDRLEEYSTKISLCENGCELVNVIDKGKDDNPRSVCNCNFKVDTGKSNDNYTFIYDKSEGKDVSNFNVLKCVNNVFSSKEIEDNFIFWIFLILLIIFIIIFLIIFFCGKTQVEGILKIKKVESENSSSSQSKLNNLNISEKISSINSDVNYQSVYVKDNKSSSKNKVIKISYAQPPKKFKEATSTKPDHQVGSRTENISINTTINFNNKFEIKFKEEDDIYDEIFPDYNEVLNNNYYENKYMKNNYINLRLKSLKLKKYFLNPLGKDEFLKHNNTDTEDEFGDINYYQNKKSRASINYYKTLLPKAEISRNILKNYYYKNPQLETEYDANKKVNMKKSLKFSEDSNFLGDGNANRLKGRKMKNSKKLNDSDTDNNDLFIHKKKKSLLSSDNEKKSNNSSSIRDLNKQRMMDNYFLNSSNKNDNIIVQYSFCKFYWVYLNKSEFCLISIYNMRDNVASYIRIATFLFVIALLFTINCLLLTSNQIHKRHIYAKENGSLNEFTYIFKKEIGTVFLLVLIYIIIKILFIKLIYGKLFKITYSAKEDLSPYGIESEKDEDKSLKRREYLKKYRKKSLIYIVIILVLMILIGYISICYFGIFKNSKVGLAIRFVISFIFSIIICAILCLIIVLIYHCSRKKGKISRKIYRICDIIY